jgi:geranylgeranyl diphosphate synthase, type II
MAAVLDRFIEAERRPLEEALERATRLPGVPAVTAEPVRYAVAAGGKRLRPLLVVAGYRACRDDVPPPVYDLAAAVELIHTYSLIHDDLPSMDDDEMRRGLPAVHVAFGVEAATAAGAAMIPLSLRLASEACGSLGLSGAATRDVLVPLYHAAGGGGMVGGQVLDLEAEGRALRSGQLEEIHGKKTGALLGVAPRLGAAAAGAGSRVLESMERYGRSLGLAFQIADDILDVTGTAAVLGKRPGRDDELEKATFAVIEGVEPARARARAAVEAALAALRAGGVRSEELEALARYAAERDR